MYRYSDHKYTSSIPANPTFSATNFFVKRKKDGSTEDVLSFVFRKPMLNPAANLHSSNDVCVVSFNLLSATFSDFDNHKSVTPDGEPNPAVCKEHEPVRWSQTLDMLESYMKRNCVICLQEANAKVRTNVMLHELLDKYGYSSVITNYGCIKNAGQLHHGFLGVGVLVPPTYEVVDHCTPFFTTHTGFTDRKVVVVVLKDSNGRRFAVASVHVPCMYRDQRLMEKFVKEIATTVGTVAKAWDVPYIVAGDWNMDYWDGKELAQLGLKAAHSYTATNFTNFGCKVVDGKVKTTFYMLDYCFYSSGFKGVEARELPSIPDEPGFYLPNLEFPSDHIPIEATFTLGAPKLQDGLEALTESLLSLAKR